MKLDQCLSVLLQIRVRSIYTAIRNTILVSLIRLLSFCYEIYTDRSWWRCGLSFAVARLLGLLILITLRSWMFSSC